MIDRSDNWKFILHNVIYIINTLSWFFTNAENDILIVISGGIGAMTTVSESIVKFDYALHGSNHRVTHPSIVTINNEDL